MSSIEGRFLQFPQKVQAKQHASHNLCILWKEGSTLDEMRTYSHAVHGAWGLVVKTAQTGDTLGLRVLSAHLLAARGYMGTTGLKTEGGHLKRFAVQGVPVSLLPEGLVEVLRLWNWDVEYVSGWVKHQQRSAVVQSGDDPPLTSAPPNLGPGIVCNSPSSSCKTPWMGTWTGKASPRGPGARSSAL